MGAARDASPRNRRQPDRCCRRRESFEGQEHAMRRPVSRRDETRRTPGSGAGRNKPARSKRKKPSRWCETTRTARGNGWLSFPRREPRRRGSRESDSSIRDDGGAIFGQTQERQCGRQVGPHGSGRDGKVGVKVRRVAHTRFRVSRAPVVGTSRAPPYAERWYVEGRGGERQSQQPRNRPGVTPPVYGPRREERTARTRSSRESAAPSECAWSCHTHRPLGVGSSTRRKARTTLKTRRTHIPARLGPPRHRHGGAGGKPGQPILALKHLSTWTNRKQKRLPK